MPQKRSSTSRRTAIQNQRIAKIAKRVLYKNTETKVKMNHINEANLLTTTVGTFYDPMTISEGTGPDNRIGSQISLSGYQIKGVLNNTSTTEFVYVRMALFYTTDRSQVDANSELFLNRLHTPLTGSTGGGLDMIYHPFNKSKVKVVNEKIFRLAPNSTGNSTGTKFYNMFSKLHNRKIEFEHDEAGGADNVSPRLHLGIWTATASDDDVTTTIEFSGLVRLWYKDI